MNPEDTVNEKRVEETVTTEAAQPTETTVEKTETVTETPVTPSEGGSDS